MKKTHTHIFSFSVPDKEKNEVCVCARERVVCVGEWIATGGQFNASMCTHAYRHTFLSNAADPLLAS